MAGLAGVCLCLGCPLGRVLCGCAGFCSAGLAPRGGDVWELLVGGCALRPLPSDRVCARPVEASERPFGIDLHSHHDMEMPVLMACATPCHGICWNLMGFNGMPQNSHGI